LWSIVRWLLPHIPKWSANSLQAIASRLLLPNNLSDIVELAFDKKGRLYVLENTTGNQYPMPGTRKILRVDGKNDYTGIATGLSLPTAITFGPDGNLYVSSLGFGPPPG
jgi:hypothetical protein